MFDPSAISAKKAAESRKREANAKMQRMILKHLPRVRRSAIESISVQEVACEKEGCSPYDTVVVMYWRSGDCTTRAIPKRLAEVDVKDVRDCLADIAGAHFAPIVIQHTNHWDLITEEGIVRSFRAPANEAASEAFRVEEVVAFLDTSMGEHCFCGDESEHLHGIIRRQGGDTSGRAGGDPTSRNDEYVKLIPTAEQGCALNHCIHALSPPGAEGAARDGTALAAPAHGPASPPVPAGLLEFSGSASDMLSALKAAGLEGSTADAATAAQRAAQAAPSPRAPSGGAGAQGRAGGSGHRCGDAGCADAGCGGAPGHASAPCLHGDAAGGHVHDPGGLPSEHKHLPGCGHQVRTHRAPSVLFFRRRCRCRHRLDPCSLD